MQPLFILSLPRCGSTLLQRLLGCHPEIATAAEPWILLPLVYTLKPAGVRAEFDHQLATSAIADFYERFPNGKADYLAEMRGYVMKLYAKAAGRECRYFLDKTPRYHLIAADIRTIFPDAKVVYLWRHPLAMLASFITYFGHDQWNLYAYRRDLFDGLARLVATYEQDRARASAVRYEDLVAEPAKTLAALTTYLDLPAAPEAIDSFHKVELGGRMGDHLGIEAYKRISTEPLDKWKSILANPLRRNFARRYLNWIGAARLSAMGYSLDALQQELNVIPWSANHLLSDSLRMTYGALRGERREP